MSCRCSGWREGLRPAAKDEHRGWWGTGPGWELCLPLKDEDLGRSPTTSDPVYRVNEGNTLSKLLGFRENTTRYLTEYLGLNSGFASYLLIA